MLLKAQALSHAVKQYLMITANYWAFTLTDGALRMLIVLYFYQLGYEPLAIAFLFLFYEAFGVITNLVGGWLGARIGLNKTMNIGLFLQILALLMLTASPDYLTTLWVMVAQALSGIAKDLNKMSAKSSVKTLVVGDQDSLLFRWIALLTGSKNALKGIGFFLGAYLLAVFGFSGAMWVMAIALMFMLILSLKFLSADLGKASYKPKFTQMFTPSKALNYLSIARLFLFASRDVWFVVALPVFFMSQLHWEHEWVGSFMALWIILYGFIQAFSPKFLKQKKQVLAKQSLSISALLKRWGGLLALVVVLIIAGLYYSLNPNFVLVVGLLFFAICFAINSALHSFVIVAMAKDDGISMDVGFYYMANALGRLIGTVLSGVIYQIHGLSACLLLSAVFVLISTFFIAKVPIKHEI